MKLYTDKKDCTGKNVVLEDMILTKELVTTAGSKMLENYKSLFDAQVVTKLNEAGYEIAGKANVGEMNIDLVGETSYFGACEKDGKLTFAGCELLDETDAEALIGLDAFGSPRRAAALSGKVCVKPTYGTVSRYGTVSIACSGECVSVSAKSVGKCREILDVIVGHDDKDGTSLDDEKCFAVKTTGKHGEVKKIAVAKSITENADEATKEKIADFVSVLNKHGIETVEVDDKLLLCAKTAWGVLMSAELCNNVSKFDGVKYGYRTPNYKTIGELYTNSRTEAFGPLLKTAILYGSEVLSTENYMKLYDKSMRIRRLICEKLDEIFEKCDALIMPACSKTAYTKADTDENKYISYDENVFTAPASISGLPAIVVGGVQLVGKAFSENALFDIAEIWETEEK